MIKMPICEVCNANTSIGVACVPGIPASAAYCAVCLRANAHPWDYLVANTAMLGGLEHSAPWWREMVEDTCKHLGKTQQQFDAEVTASMIQMDEYERSIR